MRGTLRRDERGFTLPELLTTIAILGILIAIAIIIWLSLLERWRVDAAANQIAADLRLAHTRATNQLTDWRVVLVPQDPEEDSDEDLGADYYLVKLAQPYDGDVPASAPVVASGVVPVARTLPANVKVTNHKAALNDAALPGWVPLPGPVAGRARTLEFNSDGTMAFNQGPAGSVCVTVDGDPEVRVTVLSATSRVAIRDQSCPQTDADQS
jgi:prepilin-type N-terminal cleavage/methylation domain-containing protein